MLESHLPYQGVSLRDVFLLSKSCIVLVELQSVNVALKGLQVRFKCFY